MRGWAICLLVLALAGCGGKKITTPPAAPAPTPAKSAAPWPAPADPMKLAVKAGLAPETHEFLLLHVHAHLDVFVNGKPVTVPAGIGIAIHDPGVHSAKQEGSTVYGFIDPPCAQPCISPLHTHDITGILHTEAKKNQFNNLGEFFTEWAVRLDRKCVGGYCKPAAPITIYVDGKPDAGDPRQIKLADKREIAIVIGSPPAEIPSSFG